MAIPEEWLPHLEEELVPPDLSKDTPACYGFSVIGKVKEGREQAIRDYGKEIEAAVAAESRGARATETALLTVGAVRCRRGHASFSIKASLTPISTSTSGRCHRDLQQLAASPPCSRTWRGFPEDWADQHFGGQRVSSVGHHSPELPRIRGVPLRHGGRGQKGTSAESGVLRHAGPNAVMIAAGAIAVLELRQTFNTSSAMTRTPALTGRYEFLTFDGPAGGRAWLTELLDRVQSAADAVATMDGSRRWVTLAFTWNGLRALGVSEDALATFPDEFRKGMAARAAVLGDTGRNHPDNWVGGLAGDELPCPSRSCSPPR